MANDRPWTPRPWEVEPMLASDGDAVVTANKGLTAVCNIYDHYLDKTAQVLPNAHLIAQAPAMYDELEELVEYLEALLAEVYKDVDSSTHKYLKGLVTKTKATLAAANPKGGEGA